MKRALVLLAVILVSGCGMIMEPPCEKDCLPSQLRGDYVVPGTATVIIRLVMDSTVRR